jgi:hypothetical protein
MENAAAAAVIAVVRRMKQRRPFMPASIAAAVIAIGLSSYASAARNLDPFARNLRAQALSPFRTAQAEAEPVAADAVPETKQESEGASRPPVAATATATATATTTTTATGRACSRDVECPVDTICEQGVCRSFERAFNLLLFRKEGATLDFIPFYWSRRGNPGYRVLLPVYWHFWSPESRTQIVAPFYWRIEDHLKQRVVTVVGLYSQTRQPDARSWALWPIFYSSTKFGWAAPLLGSFSIGDPDKGSSLGLLSFLYFWKRSADHKFDVCPLFVSSRSKESAFTYALPLNFYWRSGHEATLLILPLAFRHTDPKGGYFGSWLGYSSLDGENKTGAFLWLYWFGRSKSFNYDVGFPLLWSFRSPEANTTIIPPVFHVRRGGRSMGSAALLAWWGRDRDNGSSWQLILPFFLGSRADHDKRALYLSPLGGYRRDDNAGSHGLTWLVPPVLRWHDRQSELESYLLLYWRYRDIPANATTTVVGPYYQRTDPGGTTRAVFPLFWYFHDRAQAATAHSLLPFYFHRHSPDERTTAAGIFPLWAFHRHFSDGGSSTGLFPVVFFGQRADRSHQVVVPLYWHFRDGQSSTTLAFPLWYHAEDASSSLTAIWPLLFFTGHDHEASYHIQIPLLWHFADSHRGTSTTVAPLFFRDVDRTGSSAGIVPVFFWGSGSQHHHFVVFPIFGWVRDDAADRTTTVVGTYLHRSWGGETTDALFPLFYYRRGARPGGQDETSFTLFPLLHYRRDSRSTLFASPLAAWTRRADFQAGFVLPYFWYRDDKVQARGVPLLYLDHTFRGTGQRTRMFGPYVMVDGPSLAARVLFPLYARYREKGETGTYVFPFYFGRRDDSGYHMDSFLPLFWSSHDQDHRTLMVGPWFHTENHQAHSHASGLIPLFVSADSPQRRLLVTPLFVYHHNHQSQTSRVVSPLYFQSSRPEESMRVVFPLWWQGSQGSKSYAMLMPLYWHFANSEEQTSFDLAGPLLWARHGSETTRGLLPLFWYSRDRANQTGSEAVLPLFYERHSRLAQTFTTALFGFGKAPDSLWWYAGNFVWRDNWKTRFCTFFPLWFSYRDKVTETTTQVIPPLLHYAHFNPERSLSTWLLLFWRRSDITSSTTLGLPLFYDVHSYHESRLTMLLPLFLRYRNEVSDQSYTVAPLFYRRSGATDSSTIAFPLYWRFWSQERSTTVVFPFYFGVRRPTWEGNFIFPSIWYSRGLGPEAGTSHFWFVPFWESQVKRPGDYMWEALLGVLGWERIGRNRYLKVLFIPFELEPVSAAQTSWYGRTPKRAIGRTARGLSTQAW